MMRSVCANHKLFQQTSGWTSTPFVIERPRARRTRDQKSHLSFSYSQRAPSLQACRATLLEVVDNRTMFDSDAASLLLRELRKNFNSGKTKSYEWRISQLKRIVKMLEDNEKDIIEALYKDLSKPELEAYTAEISTLKSSCAVAIKELKNWMTPEQVETSLATYPSAAKIVPEPLGVVLVISTWNFPFLLSLDPMIGAIAAGNAVVLKPSEIAPVSSSLLAKLCEKYLDRDMIRAVEGAVPETSALLEQKWDKIFFTGGARVGRIVMSAAAKHLTPVVLELGGKCPAIVDSNVNLQVAARRIIAGKWAFNSGQGCIGVDYVIATKDFAGNLIDALRSEIRACYGEDPLNSNDLSRIVNLFHFQRLAKLIDEDGVSDKIVFGGQSNLEKLKMAPTILLDPPENSRIMREEIFGPLLPVITVEKLEDGIDFIRSKPKPLAAYLFTDDEQLKNRFVDSVSAGGIAINDTVLHVTVDGLPFGGVGESGMGCYHGKFSFDAFSHKKPVLCRSFAGDASVRYPPYSPKKLRLMKSLLGGDLLGAVLALIG